MMFRLLLLFVGLPAVELGLLIEIGSRIGTAATLALIAVTGIVGAALARRQGLGALRVLQTETAAGRLPAGSLVDGVIILVAGALLVTPGVLTDAFGFLCLVPGFRRLVKRALRRRLERAAHEGRVEVRVYADDPWGPREEKVVRDVGTEPGSGVPGAEAGAEGESPRG
jgi:UPF0716 protein FxsA